MCKRYRIAKGVSMKRGIVLIEKTQLRAWLHEATGEELVAEVVEMLIELVRSVVHYQGLGIVVNPEELPRIRCEVRRGGR
jgi:hypothetical protein